MTLPSSIRRSEIAPNYPVFEINHPMAFARVALHGAQLLEWTPKGQKPVIYLSPDAVYHEGKAVRGGIPVCWPWFGMNEADKNLPQHGFVRSRFWELAAASEDEAGVVMKFTMQDDEATRRLWPHAFRLVLEMRIGAELHVALSMKNTGETSFSVTGALHSYFVVGDIHQVVIEGLDGTEYLDTVGTRTERHQTGDIVFDREVDRNYHSSGEIRINDKAWERMLKVHREGSETAVVWNPWIAKAAALADMPDEDYLRFVCVEAANAWRDSVTVPPAATHKLVTTVRIE